MDSNKTYIKVIIIDDELHAIEELEKILSEYENVRVMSKISDPSKAVEAILQIKPDLLFMDIQMPGITGFDIVNRLNLTTVKPAIIFVTAFEQYAIRALRASAFDYLLKPVDRGEMVQVIDRYILKSAEKKLEFNYSKLLDLINGKKLRFNTTGGFVVVDPREIVYIQADWNYSELFLSKEKHELIALNLGKVENMLPKGKFARISRSVIINLDYLEKVHRSKRLCLLKKENISYEFKIPLLRIRFLEGLI
jgi:two-component system LytT family response regulator